MMKLPSRFAQRLPAIAMLAAVMAISGCQKDAETTPADGTQSTSTEATNSQASTAPLATETAATTDQQVKSSSLTILALGDSLTEGLGVDKDDNYPAQLEDRLQEMGYANAKVINSGLSGETSTGLVNRLDWVSQTKPDITILTIGANDAIRGIDVATIEANIRTAVKHLQDNGSVVILGGMSIYDNLGSEYVAAFSDIYPRIAKDMNLTLIPFFLEGVGGDRELNQADAIHPTKEATRLSLTTTSCLF
ncbi:arylesterase [Psychrobacter sp. JCM 18900]|uniref:arylesterase n=1 Tax=Psychrobacter sp. JCM 18900 TaxID=1298608 RepID=UPI0004BAABE6|nr:arylesterase [Psychrobacter sp. JCM 18900]